ncbi:unnamed protein product [Porites lobata]|uniref:Uncharacterized protein n=1 Tax=Porites lobata TaxID=104759 RepID=A0ABN8RTD2_9CNID|nr:unnamed protein product [Porites lobata]
MATFYSYLLVFHCLSLVQGQLLMEINRGPSLGFADFFRLPRNTTACLGDISSNSCFKYRASPGRIRRIPCLCSCSTSPFEVSRLMFFEPSNSCLEVSLARRRSGNITCLSNNAVVVGAGGSGGMVVHGDQVSAETRDNASSFLRKNQGRIFRVAVQCRHQRKTAVAKSTCVMFKVPGTIYCPIPQQNSSKQSATLPPPTLEITSTTGFPPRPTTQAEKSVTLLARHSLSTSQTVVLNLRLSSNPLRILPNVRGLPSNFATTYNSKAYALPSSRRQHSARRLPIKQDGLVYKFTFG